MPKPPQNTSVSSLSLSLFLSLSEGQFTFILPLFKLLTFDSFLFLYVGFINLHCWQEKRSRVWRQDVFHSLCRPGSHAGGVQPSPELFFFFFTTLGRLKMCENWLAFVSSRVENYSGPVFQEGIKPTIRTDYAEARSALSCECGVWENVCVCVRARVCSMFLLRLSFREATGPWLACTDLSWTDS